MILAGHLFSDQLIIWSKISGPYDEQATGHLIKYQLIIWPTKSWLTDQILTHHMISKELVILSNNSWPAKEMFRLCMKDVAQVWLYIDHERQNGQFFEEKRQSTNLSGSYHCFIDRLIDYLLIDWPMDLSSHFRWTFPQKDCLAYINPIPSVKQRKHLNLCLFKHHFYICVFKYLHLMFCFAN